MKNLMLLAMFLILLPLSSAASVKDITLNLGDSYLLDGKNITLVRSAEEGTFLCINQEKAIVSKDKRVQNLFIDYRNSDESEARFKINYDCGKDCVCDGDECNNDLCIQSILSVGAKEEEFQESDEVECVENLDCEDNELCTEDTCLEGQCFYKNSETCAIDEIPQNEGTSEQDVIVRSLAYILLAIVALLAVISAVKVLRK